MSQEAVSRRAWAVVWCAWFLGFAIFSRILCLPPIANHLKAALSITHSKVGLIFSLPVAILAATAVPSGLFGDRVGPRRAVGIGMIVLAAGSLASGTASNFQSLFLYTCVFGIGFSMAFSSLPKLMGLWLPAGKIGLGTGVYTTGIAIGGAVSLGITLPVIFPVTKSFRGAFFIWSIPAAVGAVLWWLVVKEHSSPASIPQSPSMRKGMGQAYHVWKNRNLWVAAFTLFFLNTQFYTWVGWTPHLMVMKGAEPEVAALMISFNSWISIPFMFLIPWVSYKVGLVRPFIWLAALGFILSAWAAIYIPAGLGWPLMFLLGALFAIYPLLLTLPVDLAPKEYVGAASGMVLSIGYMGALVGPWLAGYFLDVFDTLSPALVFLIGSGIALGGFGLLLPETGFRSKEHKGNI